MKVNFVLSYATFEVLDQSVAGGELLPVPVDSAQVVHALDGLVEYLVVVSGLFLFKKWHERHNGLLTIQLLESLGLYT